MQDQEQDLNTTQITGHVSQFNNSQYIGAPDLLNDDGASYKEITLEIAGVYRRLVFNPGNNQREEKTIIDFKGAKKDMIVNKTNTDIIAKRLQSDRFEDWPGKSITLVVKDVRLGRDKVKGLRVK